MVGVLALGGGLLGADLLHAKRLYQCTKPNGHQTLSPEPCDRKEGENSFSRSYRSDRDQVGSLRLSRDRHGGAASGASDSGMGRFHQPGRSDIQFGRRAMATDKRASRAAVAPRGGIRITAPEDPPPNRASTQPRYQPPVLEQPGDPTWAPQLPAHMQAKHHPEMPSSLPWNSNPPVGAVQQGNPADGAPSAPVLPPAGEGSTSALPPVEAPVAPRYPASGTPGMELGLPAPQLPTPAIQEGVVPDHKKEERQMVKKNAPTVEAVAKRLEEARDVARMKEEAIKALEAHPDDKRNAVASTTNKGAADRLEISLQAFHDALWPYIEQQNRERIWEIFYRYQNTGAKMMAKLEKEGQGEGEEAERARILHQNLAQILVEMEQQESGLSATAAQSDRP